MLTHQRALSLVRKYGLGFLDYEKIRAELTNDERAHVARIWHSGRDRSWDEAFESILRCYRVETGRQARIRIIARGSTFDEAIAVGLRVVIGDDAKIGLYRVMRDGRKLATIIRETGKAPRVMGEIQRPAEYAYEDEGLTGSRR